MKIFGRKESDTSTVLNDQEKRLQLAIDAVTSSLKVNNITNELEAELVLSALLENFGYQLDTQQLRDHDFTIEQNQQQILRVIDEVHELLSSSLSTPVIQAALSSFVSMQGLRMVLNQMWFSRLT